MGEAISKYIFKREITYSFKVRVQNILKSLSDNVVQASFSKYI